MNINCIIIEDEPLAQKLLKDYIGQVEFLTLQGTFNNPLEAIPFLKENNTDLIFLDIEMPKLNGMDFLDVIENSPKIIFTTAYSSYAVESYERNALDYLLKPISFERFLAAVNKYRSGNTEMYHVNDDKNADGDSIFIKSDRNLVQLSYNEITHISGLKDYVKFHTEKESYIVYHTLKELQEKLPEMFLRVHNSYLVNLNKINTIKDNRIYISGDKIPISHSYKKELFAKIDEKLL